jgi:hypothetical protein
VVRVDFTLSKSAPPIVEAMTVIGSGFVERTDPAALVIGPTADSLNNRITEIPYPIQRYRTAPRYLCCVRSFSASSTRVRNFSF